MENKFYKISHSGGTYVTGLFYNPITKETKSELLRDYDYSDGSRDNEELYWMPIDEEALKIYRRDKGIISIGDLVEVVKGRTIKHGYTNVVVDIKEYKDRYGRWLADYAYFGDGKKVNIDNCKLL